MGGRRLRSGGLEITRILPTALRLELVLLDQASQRAPFLASRQARLRYISVMRPQEIGYVLALELFNSCCLAPLESRLSRDLWGTESKREILRINYV